MTSGKYPLGTNRIISVTKLADAEIMVNVQAREPSITSKVIDRLINSVDRNECDVAIPANSTHGIYDLLKPKHRNVGTRARL